MAQGYDAGLQGFAAGFGGVNNYFENLMNRARQKKQMQMAEEAQAQNMALRKQQEERAKQLLPYDLQERQLKQQLLEREVDPRKKMEFLQSMRGAFGGGGQAVNQDTQQPSAIEPQSTGQQPQSNTMQPQQNAVIQTPFGMLTPEDAQVMLASGFDFPAVKKQLENYYNLQYEGAKTQSQETQKAKVKEDTVRGEALQGIQSSKDAVDRIQQTIANYQKEAKDMGYGTRTGFGADWLTEPNAFYRLMGSGAQTVSHPLETLMHPADFITPDSQGKKLHSKYLSNLRGQLNELVNTRAKDLNTRFTQREYEILQQNKPSISDTMENLVAKLHAIESALNSGYQRIMAEESQPRNLRAGQTPFAVESQSPAGEFGRQAVGQYKDKSKKFIDPNNPAYTILEE